jgi:hypothetical protein
MLRLNTTNRSWSSNVHARPSKMPRMWSHLAPTQNLCTCMHVQMPTLIQPNASAKLINSRTQQCLKHWVLIELLLSLYRVYIFDKTSTKDHVTNEINYCRNNHYKKLVSFDMCIYIYICLVSRGPRMRGRESEREPRKTWPMEPIHSILLNSKCRQVVLGSTPLFLSSCKTPWTNGGHKSSSINYLHILTLFNLHIQRRSWHVYIAI